VRQSCKLPVNFEYPDTLPLAYQSWCSLSFQQLIHIIRVYAQHAIIRCRRLVCFGSRTAAGLTQQQKGKEEHN
jgi:hypothetical protein